VAAGARIRFPSLMSQIFRPWKRAAQREGIPNTEFASRALQERIDRAGGKPVLSLGPGSLASASM
jgi:hypothetical protein